MSAPTNKSVQDKAAEYLKHGKKAFFKAYSSGRRPRAHYVEVLSTPIPVKALWAAAHNPSIQTGTFHTGDALRGLSALGFTKFIGGEAAEQYQEGQRLLREIKSFARNPKLVADAKAYHGLICKACDFDFSSLYGPLGAGYIECHHIVPVSNRGGKSRPTTRDDVTVLCANCHRMVHRHKPALTVAELRTRLVR